MMTVLRMGCFLALSACLPAQNPPQPAQTRQAAQPAITGAVQPAKAPEKVPDLPPNTVVLTIGGEKITLAQFNLMADALPEQSRAAAKGPQRQQFAEFLTQMIALAQEGKRKKLDETEAFKAALAYQIDNTLAGLTYTEMTKDLKPPDAELKKYYDEHQADMTQVHARHILIRFQGSPVPAKPEQKELTDAEALAKIQAIRKRIAGGEDFAEVAKKESDDTGSGANGGDLGTFGRGQMVPAFEEVAMATKPGELSEPVKTQFGYHLIKVESKTVKTFADVRADLEKQLGQTQIQKAVEDLVKKTPVVMDPAFFPPRK